ncbi:hypothetical protein [Nocardioides limicola]|uniref:hypothetical protein n=1 Tax=Nocardioides limicola TaxID=2803368 RepID=UPI00193C28FD|nr:hypothetical protein [Nocardioides sp. DJM-14]
MLFELGFLLASALCLGLGVVAIAVPIVLLVRHQSQAARQRQARLQELAHHLGWQWVESDREWPRQFLGRRFQTGSGRVAQHILTGWYRERALIAFDYRYTTGSGKDQTTHRLSVVGLDTGVSFPALEVMPAGLLTDLGARLTGRSLQFESEDFNRAFTVTCPDRRFASDVIHPTMMSLLLRLPDRCFQVEGRWLMAVNQGQHEPREVIRRADALTSILDEIPEFVWRAYRSELR